MNVTAEAEKIRWEFLSELEVCLDNHSPDERADLIHSFFEHINEAIHHEQQERITGDVMRDIIAKLGPVDEIVESAKNSGPRESRVSEASTSPTPGGYSTKVLNYVFVKNIVLAIIVGATTLVMLTLIDIPMNIGAVAGVMTCAMYRSTWEGYRKGLRGATMADIKANFYHEIFSK